MANGGKSLTEDLRKKSSEEAIKSFQEGAERFNKSLVESVTERLINEIKAEAIKEFAERLKEHLKGYGGLYCVTTMNVHIDNLVKEMVGDTE